MTRLRHSTFLATVAYADVFDYPLTRKEVSLWSIGGIGRTPIRDGAIECIGEYLVLPGRKRIIALRKRRQAFAVAKWRRVRGIAAIFRIIPTVALVGVTGGLAVDNARRNDDIDLFFIARRGTLWITRLLVTLLTELKRIRRRPNERDVSDKICLNMFMAEDSLMVPRSEQDLFAAHEVLQMVPLWEREGIYRTFLSANRWVKNFLPNAWKAVNHEYGIMNHEITTSRYWYSFSIQYSVFMLQLLEPFARALQLRYMRKRRTNEVIRSGLIRFHPRDARVWVREKYAIRLRQWNIPLDKVFYRR